MSEENRRIKYVLFDMDGTILDTLEDLTNSVNYVLSQYGFPTRRLEEYRRFFGSGIAYAIRCAAPEGTSEETIAEMVSVFRPHYNAHCMDNTGPYDGILQMMRGLKERGYRLAIVSNKIDSAVQELNRRFFAEYVDAAVGEKPGVQRKPAPDMVDAALRALRGPEADESGNDSCAEGSCADAVYVGDTEVDLKTAENSGLPCIAVLWGFRGRDQLEKAGATVFAETPEEIIEILEKDPES